MSAISKLMPELQALVLPADLSLPVQPLRMLRSLTSLTVICNSGLTSELVQQVGLYLQRLLLASSLLGAPNTKPACSRMSACPPA